VDNPVSAINVMEKWIPEVRHFCRPCPVILVGCKIDLRTDNKTITKLKQHGERLISTEDGRQMAAYIKADAYMECSAKTGEGVDELFEYAARLSLKKPPSHNQCMACILQ
jgi:Ras family protein A